MSYAEKGLYGGAIVGAIPTGWIDSSDLREVPDHQEIFLSPTTLSNLIIELNQSVPTAEVLALLGSQQEQSTAPRGGTPATKETIDKAAAQYHLHDLCDEGDTIQTVIAPESVSLPRFGFAADAVQEHRVRAYKGVASFTTPKTQRSGSGSGSGGGGRIPASVDGSAATTVQTGSGSGIGGADTPQISRLTCHYLMVRLEKQETDLLVFVNVPHDEFDAQGDPRGLSREEEVASGLIDRMVEVLEVKSWGLFA